MPLELLTRTEGFVKEKKIALKDLNVWTRKSTDNSLAIASHPHKTAAAKMRATAGSLCRRGEVGEKFDKKSYMLVPISFFVTS
jgi:hypothetical protein